MTKQEAINILEIALTSYCEDNISTDLEEKKKIDEAFNLLTK